MESYPPQATVEELRRHFRTAYKLKEEQIDLMITSSAGSLRSIFLEVDGLPENESLNEKIAALAHTVKGLLLNMGQVEWAEYAKEIEYTAKAGEEKDYKSMMKTLRAGLQEICGP